MRLAPLAVTVLAIVAASSPVATALLSTPHIGAFALSPLSVEDVFAERSPMLVHRNHEVEAALKALATAKPDLVTYGTHGSSFLGFPIHDACLSARPTDAEGRGFNVYLDGGHHGNEFLGVEFVMMMTYYLVDNYGRDDAVTHLLDNGKVCVTPIVNPDGNYLDTRKNGNQVDINRNYPYEFGLKGASDNPAAPNYHGAAPLSEPETRANVEFAASVMPDLWVTMHTGIKEMYWPWSYTNSPPPDAAFFERLEAPFEEASRGSLDAMQSAELYIAMGDTEDYGYGALGIPSFVIETHGDQFQVAYLDGTFQELLDQFEGLKWLVMNVEKMGANVHVHDHVPEGDSPVKLTQDSASFWLHNKGFGDATNVSLVLSRGNEVLREEVLTYLGASAHLNFTFEGLTATDGLVLELDYAELRIPSSATNTFRFVVGSDVEPASSDRTVPGVNAAIMLALVGLIGLVATRRRSK